LILLPKSLAQQKAMLRKERDMSGHLPLRVLEAIAFDTETTGLDASQARLLQLGAVRLKAGGLGADMFESKVDPGVPIPAASTRIHGLSTDHLAGGPPFTQAYARFRAYAADHVLIGHHVGFDLAILARECTLARVEPPRNRVLDTRLLAEICFPRLGSFTLDALASHLGLDVSNRHDALADAQVTGRLFLALVPKLKEKGIRTLAEAEAACKTLTSVLESYSRAGWVEPLAVAGQDAALARIDAYPFRHRVRDIAHRPPVIVSAQTRLGEAVTVMAEKGISSVFVTLPETSETGIITERDVIRLIGKTGRDVLDQPLSSLASRPLMSVPADAFIYRAIGRMERHHIRHLGVVDETGAMIGALSARDLLRLRSSDALALGDAVDTANSLADLEATWARMPHVAQRLSEEGVSASEIAAVVSREIGALTRRAAMEAEAQMQAEGHGGPPGPYAVLLLGSGGRGESLLIPDQDNAIIHADTDRSEHAGTWFIQLGRKMNQILDEIGIPLCKGHVMAGNPAWNGGLEQWRERFRHWTETVDPEDLLSVDIFFDFRLVAGDATLATALRSEALAHARHGLAMIKLLAKQLENWSPPVGFLGRIVTDDGRVDLKKGGLFPIVAAARCLALSHGMAERGTLERLRALMDAKIGAESDLAKLAHLHTVLESLILKQQLHDIAAGKPPTTTVEIKTLSREELSALKEGLSHLRIVPALVRDLLFSL
jgi:CBS domain-containing protein